MSAVTDAPHRLLVSHFTNWTQAKRREVDVQLPQASEARPLTSKPTELVVNVDRNGAYTVHANQQTPAALLDILSFRH